MYYKEKEDLITFIKLFLIEIPFFSKSRKSYKSRKNGIRAQCKLLSGLQANVRLQKILNFYGVSFIFLLSLSKQFLVNCHSSSRHLVFTLIRILASYVVVFPAFHLQASFHYHSNYFFYTVHGGL